MTITQTFPDGSRDLRYESPLNRWWNAYHVFLTYSARSYIPLSATSSIKLPNRYLPFFLTTSNYYSRQNLSRCFNPTISPDWDEV